MHNASCLCTRTVSTTIVHEPGAFCQLWLGARMQWPCIIITTEYNHGPAAVLKNALDWVYNQWNNKPVAFISYASGAAAGIRAVEQLRQIAVELQMAPIQKAMHISSVLTTIDENGVLLKGAFDKQLSKLVDQLLWWAKVLKVAREKNTTDL